jgi:hypothetical protein
MQEDAVFPLQNIPVYFQNHVPKPYVQPGSPVFEPRLSCLDALANLPSNELRGIIRGTEWWESWDERAEEHEREVLNENTRQYAPVAATACAKAFPSTIS